MSEYPYSFTAKVELHHIGGSAPRFRVVFLPEEITTRLQPRQHLRVDGEINGIRFQGAVHSAKGRWYLMVSKSLMRVCGLAIGKAASVEFDVGDQDAVDVPIELLYALDADEEASRHWAGLTAGRRRSFAYRVASGKMQETRLRRVEEVLSVLREASAAKRLG